MTSLPYIAIGDRAGGVAAELLNGCRQLAYLRPSPVPPGVPPSWAHPSGWTAPLADECRECCCPAWDHGPYTYPADPRNPAPWYDPARPATAEAFGVAQAVVRVETAADEAVRAEGRAPTVTLTGVAVGSTRAGLHAMLEWLETTAGGADGCGTVPLITAAHCAQNPRECAPPNGRAWEPPLDISSDNPQPVASPAAPPLADDGGRVILAARFASMSRPVDETGVFADCVAQPIVLRWDIDTSAGVWSRAPLWCAEIDAFFACEPSPAPLPDPVDGSCRPDGLPDTALERPVSGVPDGTAAGEPARREVEPLPALEPAADCSDAVLAVLSAGVPVAPDGTITPSATVTGSWTPAAGWDSDAAQTWADWLAASDTFDAAQFYAIAESPKTAVVMHARPSGVTFAAVDRGGTVDCSTVALISQPGHRDDTDTAYPWGCPDDGSSVTWEAKSTALSAADMRCLRGGTAVAPTLAGAALEGRIPWPVIYGGRSIADGDALADALTADRGCPIRWNGETDDPPQTYVVPNSCARGQVVDLAWSPDPVRPILDGEPAPVPVPWPVLYRGQVITSGEHLAEVMTAERGCPIGWDGETSRYLLSHRCETRAGTVAELTSNLATETAGSGWARPERIRRGAAFLPSMPGTTGTLDIEICNGTEPVRNLELVIYDAVAGAPHILHGRLGGPRYHAMPPLGVIRVDGIPAGGSVRVDGRDNSATMACADGSSVSAAGWVTGPDLAPVSVPMLDCSPKWIEARVDCDHQGALDLRVRVALHVR